jgi:hypothetical protein
MPTYADVCRRMLTYADYSAGAARDAARMLTYADVC